MVYISVAEAARRAGVDVRTVQRWIARKKLPARKIDGRALVILEDDLSFFVAQRPARVPSELDAIRARLDAIEARLDGQAREIAALSRPAPTELWATDETTQGDTAATSERLPQGLPAGSMIASHFAKLHKNVIKERTLTGHLADELHPVSGIKIGRVWWMTPIQQESALRFYRWH